jgi:hypothetical protein
MVVNGWIHLTVSSGERIHSTPQSFLTESGWWTTLTGTTVLPRQVLTDVLHVQHFSREFLHIVALISYLASLRVPRVLFSGRVLIQVVGGLA